MQRPTDSAEAAEKVAAVVGVSKRYVYDAKKIKEQYPFLFAEMQAGTISLPQAKQKAAPLNPGQHDDDSPQDQAIAELKRLKTVLVNAVAPLRSDFPKFVSMLKDLSADDLEIWESFRDVANFIEQLVDEARSVQATKKAAAKTKRPASKKKKAATAKGSGSRKSVGRKSGKTKEATASAAA